MDSLKSLMDRKEYDIVLRLTKNSTDPNELFYRVSAFLGSGKYNEALECIETNKLILQSDLLLLMKVHIEILCILGRFDEAYAALDYYKNLPYESQRVEELLKELPEMIRLEEKKRFTTTYLKEDELIKKLGSNDQNDVLMAIDSVRPREIGPYLPALNKVMVNYPKQSIRSFALLLLVQKKVDKELKFKHIDEIITVNPSKLEPPFVGDDFNEFARSLTNELKDPSLGEMAIQIISSYIIYIYPEKLDSNKDLLIAALYLIANEYLQSKDSKDLQEICFERGVDEEEVSKLIARIEEAMDNF